MGDNGRAVAFDAGPPTRGLIDIRTTSAEPFRSLRLAIDLRPRSGVKKPVVVTSSQQGEGKSTVAANYALVAAQNERRVLLVDADLRRPSQHLLFGLPPAPGLSDVVASSTTYQETLHQVQKAPGVLHVLTAGTTLPNPGDVVGSQTMAHLLDQAASDYDLVIVDTPPMLAADAATIASHSGADVVFVIGKGTKRRKVARAMRSLELVGVNLLGFVMNREGSLTGYGYQ